MNFAYLDARSLLDQVLGFQPEHIEPVQHELEPEWIEFEKELGKFKQEFAQVSMELAMKKAELNDKKADLAQLRAAADNITSDDLKATVLSIIDNTEAGEDVQTLTQQCRELMGKMIAQQKVLKDTGAERYAKFTCFVCMDRLVELFFDPCGHVICERCWMNTRDKTVCPGCRQPTRGAMKIYTM